MDWGNFTLKPIFIAIITFSGALTGMLGSVYADHIGNSFPLTFPTENYTWCWKAFCFWTLLLVTAFGIGFRAKYASRKFNKATNRLADLITTMPASGFMSLYRNEFKDSHSILLRSEEEAKGETLTSQNLNENIRAILDSILNIVKCFENKSSESTYGINIMQFAELQKIEQEYGYKNGDSSISEYLLNNNFTPLFFGNVGVEKLEGLLILENELSTRSDIGNLPDDKLPDRLCLPLWQSEEINGKLNILPGAPYAFQEDFYYLCSDVNSLGSWLNDNCNYETQVLDELKHYFNSQQTRDIVSFLSFRIELDGDKYGVINIHSSEKSLVSSGSLDSEIFIPCLEPFVAMLGRLIKLEEFTV